MNCTNISSKLMVFKNIFKTGQNSDEEKVSEGIQRDEYKIKDSNSMESY